MRWTRYSIAVTTPKFPPPPRNPHKQVRVLLLGRAQEVAVGGDDVEGERIVAGQPEAPAQPAESTAQREARGARVRDDARSGRKSEGRAFVVELAEQRACLDEGPRRFGLDANALHGLQVDDEPAVAGGLAGDAVAAGTDSSQQTVLACEVDGVAHIGGASAAGDQGRLPVEHAVPDTPARIVVRATLKQQVAAQTGREGLDRGAWQA